MHRAPHAPAPRRSTPQNHQQPAQPTTSRKAAAAAAVPQTFVQSKAAAPRSNTIVPELGSAADYSYEPEVLLERRSPVATIGVLGLIGAALVAVFLVFQAGDPVEVEAAEEAPAVAQNDGNDAIEDDAPEAEGTTGGGETEAPDEAAATAGEEAAAANSGKAGESGGKSAVESAGKTKKPSRGSSRGSSRGTTKKKKKKTKKKSSKADRDSARDSGQVIHELMMLSAASKALKAGNPSQALAYANQHAREFPVSQVKSKRNAIKIEALCKLGRKAQAQNESSKMGSTARAAFSKHCR